MRVMKSCKEKQRRLENRNQPMNIRQNCKMICQVIKKSKTYWVQIKLKNKIKLMMMSKLYARIKKKTAENFGRWFCYMYTLEKQRLAVFTHILKQNI